MFSPMLQGEDSPRWQDEGKSAKGSGYITQLTATIRRQLIQKRRMWTSCLLEMLLPILFVSGLLAISLVSDRVDVPAKQYVSASGPWEVGTDLRMRILCYNTSAAHPDLRSLLNPCPATTTVTCLPTGPDLPLEGLCVNGHTTVAASYVMALINNERDVQIPNYDDYVLFKWMSCAVIEAPKNLFGGMVSSGRQPGSVYVIPSDASGHAFTDYMNTTHTLFKHTFGGYFSSRDEVLPFARDVANEGKVWAVVTVSAASDKNNGLTYTLSMNTTAQPLLRNGVRDALSYGLKGRVYATYTASGALTVQKAIEDYYLKRIVNATDDDIQPATANSRLAIAPMPIDSYVDDGFLKAGGTMGPLLLVLAFLYPVSQLAKRLVEEKEQRLREGTMIMGLGRSAFFSSWLFVYYAQMVPVSIVVTIILKAGVTTGTDPLVIWISYLFFSLSTVNLSALLSTLFSKSKIAALCVPLLYFAFAIPAFALPDTTGAGPYVLLSFLCPVPFSVAMKLMFNYEMNKGLGWNSVASTTDEPYNFGVCLLFFIIDFVVYIALMLYLDNVLPKEWGTKMHPCYCCCCGCQQKKGSASVGLLLGNQPQGDVIDNPRNHQAKPNHHSVLQDYPQLNRNSSVHISNLRKEFEGANGKVNVAVDGMELRLFPDSITVFLGHNGAGKTTVMNMMTGMMSPTDGDVTIYGNSILSNMQAIRRDIGFCPQHNILWDDLTCMEHLQYFGRLKGFSGAEVDVEAEEMLRKVDLLDKRDIFSKNLSGGQKRKLSVAIAFMGRARLVLLDEPTAGMDVAARRHTWDVLKDMSKGRTIVLTTHFMDEADLLGSRIAIMSKGCLHSYGTPMFLKNNLGTGYVMRIASTTMISDPQPILREVQRVLPSAVIREAKGQEVAVALPKDDARKFPEAIRMMDSVDVKRRLNISSVSVSVASLEDVFLAIAHQEDLNGRTEEEFADEDNQQIKAAFESLERVYLKLQGRGRDASSVEMGSTGASQPPSMGSSGDFARQLGAMLRKRINNGRRDYCALCLQIFAPLICIMIAIGMSSISGNTDPAHTWYDNGLYGSVDQIVATNNCSSIDSFWDHDFKEVQRQNEPNTHAFSSYLLESYQHHGDRERMVSFSCNDTFGNNVMLVNATSRLSAPQAVTQLYRAKARAFQGNMDLPFMGSQWPLPYTDRQMTQIDSIGATIMALFILIPFTFIPSTFVAFVVRERECKSKHLQFVSGASYAAYWLGNFLFDLASYCVTVAIAMLIFLIFDQEWAVGTGGHFIGTLALFLFYGLSSIGFSYLVSFLFDVHSTAQTIIMMVNFLVGFLLVLVMFFLRSIESTADAAKVIVYFLRIVPPFALGDGLFAMVMANAMAPIQGEKSAFGFDVAGWNMLFMGLLSAVFLGATMLIDHPSRAKRRAMMNFSSVSTAPAVVGEDEDVVRERKEVEGGKRPTDVVQVQGLRKEFNLGGGRQKIAVQNITFGVKPGEVFGFLGTNGAGKTTTMSMLTTEIIPTCGNGRIGGYDIVQESDKTRRLIGYCPQFDAIMDLMTPAEHLSLFAALRGIPREDTSEVIEALINSCALQKYRDIPAGRLSGGNKRKLSVAMALIGGPSIVFLDEPSAGMDPHARRQMWDVIIFVAKHSSVVLTTHHLEEVDVLAHRVGIMDSGLMKCLGSLEHLKLKYGSGFELTIQVSETGLESATRFIASKYPAAVQVEARQQRLLYTLPFESTDLASLFETIQRATDDPSVGIVDYTVQQTSLEQVFMRISELGTADEVPAAQPGTLAVPSVIADEAEGELARLSRSSRRAYRASIFGRGGQGDGAGGDVYSQL